MQLGERRKPGGDPKPGEAKTQGLVTMQPFARRTKTASGSDDPQMPSGQPGSERETGTTETPFGKERNFEGEAEGTSTDEGDRGDFGNRTPVSFSA